MNSDQQRAFDGAVKDSQRKIRLTDRWTPLQPHDGQARYFWGNERFPVVPCGRRSGKTETAKRRGVLRQLLKRREWPARLGYCAPIQDQAKKIFWDDLKALIPKHWVAKYTESDPPCIHLKWGAEVHVMGLDKPARMEGRPWDWLYVDELADCKAGIFERHIRPALATRGREGGCDLIGVPDEGGPAQSDYEQLWEIGLRWRPGLDKLTPDELDALKADPDIISHWWPSSDIVSAKEIQAVRRNVDELAYLQEFEGRFITSGGKAVPKFDTKLHVNERFAAYCHRLPIDWTLDFGTAPAASLIGQTYKGHVWIMDEIWLQDSSTDVAAVEFLDRCGKRGYDLHRLRIFGDAAGHGHHSNVGTTDYEILEDSLRGLRNVEWLQLTAPPLIKDTLNAVRARVCTADNVIHLHVHPRCVHLIQDLKTATWPDESNKLRQHHCLAALRYWLFALFGERTGYATTPTTLPNLAGRPNRMARL